MDDLSFLEDDIALKNLIDLSAIDELLSQIVKVYGFGLLIADMSYEVLLDRTVKKLKISEDFEKILKRELTEKPLIRRQKRDLQIDEGVYVRLFPILKELDVIGILGLGPFRFSDAESHAKGQKNIPEFTPAKIESIGDLIASIVDLLVFSAYKRHLTNITHIQAISANYHELEKANQALQKSYEQLQELDQMKSNFLAVISHELRTPLTSVIGYSEMLIDGISGALNESQAKYVKVIMEKGEQLLALIGEILNLSKIEAGQMKFSPRMADPREVARSALDTIKPILDKKNIKISIDINPELPEQFVFDPEKILHIYNNLLGNAVKFTDEGGHIKLKLDVRTDGDSSSGRFFLSKVIDSGIGIPPEHLGKIFQKFYQVDDSSTRAFGGTGLGLAIVKDFVELHGGKIWADSEINQGSTFCFTIPLTIED